MRKVLNFIPDVLSRSIGAKLAALIAAVVIGGMALLSLFILGHQSNILGKQADGYAEALGDQFSLTALEPLLAGDIDAMDLLISNIARNEGIEGAAIFSDQMIPLAAAGQIPDNDLERLFSERKIYYSSEEGVEGELSSYARQVQYRDLTVGYTLLTFDRSFMGTAYRKTIKTITLITALMLVLGVIVSAMLSRRISRPVKQLVDGTNEISNGNYHFRFHDQRKDELGQLMVALNSMTEGLLRKEQVEQTFSRYVSPNVASSLMNDMEQNRLGGRHVEATVLFADMVGFTAISERLEPEEVNTLLNDYFTVIDEVAGHHCGHIDKYIGDCAMILFGAPLKDEKHTMHGVECGLEIQRVIAEYNDFRRGRGEITVEFSVGVNSGTMLAGNMGSERRMEYTVIGDAVNLAARLADVAAAGQTLVTRELLESIGGIDMFEAAILETVKLHGKREPVEVWLLTNRTENHLPAGSYEGQATGMIH